MHIRKILRPALTGFLSIASLWLAANSARAAEPLLVGVADLATKADVAKTLELSDEQVKQISQLIDRRETAGFESAMRLRGQTPEQQSETMKPFRLESQRQLAALLTDAQISKLEELRLKNPNDNYEPLLAQQAPAADEGTAEAASETEGEDEPSEDASSDESSEQPATDAGNSEEEMTEGEEEPVASTGTEEPAAGSEESTDQSTADDQQEGSGETSEEATEAEASEETTEEESEPVEVTEVPDDGKLAFNFRYQPWQDVLDWFAEQVDASLILESAPTGTFNYTDSKRYTPAEALDIINKVLLTKGYTLVRSGRMLVLINQEDGIPPYLVPDVSLDDLDNRGEHEIVRVLFKLRNMSPAVAAEEVQKLIGPQGSVVLLARAGMIQVTETAGRCRAIREVINAVERPEAQDGDVVPFELEYIFAEDALPVLRQMLNIDEGDMATDDGTLRLGIDTLTGKILATGTPEMVARVRDVLKLIDVEEAAATSSDVTQALQLEVYATTGADAESVLLVLQTLLADTPGVRIASDPATGNIVALATLDDQSTIRATIEQMRTDSRVIEAIPLVTVDAQLAVLAITKLFGGGTEEEPDPRAPLLDADLTTNTLFVRASPTQVTQIKELLSKMGETAEAAASIASNQQGNVRTLPLSGSAARTALQQVEQLWPMMHKNPIRVMIPSSGIQTYRPSDTARPPAEPPRGANPAIDFGFEEFEEFLRSQPLESPADSNESQPGAPATQPAPNEPPTTEADRSAIVTPRVIARLAVMQQGEAPAPTASPADPKPAESDAEALADVTNMAQANDAGEIRNKPGAPVVVAPGAGGTIIASEDLEALDALEQMLAITSGTSFGSTREYAVFYLKYATAPAAADTLNKMFGSGGGGGGGGGLMGGIADAALGGLGGGLMGDLLGLGGEGSTLSGFSSGTVDIVADSRLNLLLVYAQPEDIEQVNQVLQILDQAEGPEKVEAGGKPRLIPVYNTTAASIAEVVRSVYSDRIEGGGGGGGRQPSPEDFIRALRRGGGGGDGGGEAQEPEKMTIGVDERSNSIVVRASDPLFEQVEILVQELDELQSDNSQSTEIVSLKFSNSDAVREALRGVFGDEAITSGGGSSNRSTGSSSNRNGSSNSSRSSADEVRRRIEMMQRFQEFQQRSRGGGNGGSSRGGPPGGGRGGTGRGGPPGGGRGGR